MSQVQAIIAGTQKHNPSATFTLGGTAYTASALDQLFQSLIDAINAGNAARASATVAASAASAAKVKVLPVFTEYRRLLQTTLGVDAQTLADYGMQPRQAAPPRTGEQNAAAAAKAEATRRARGTASKKSKLAIKGNVTGVTVTPVTTPPSVQQASAAPGAIIAPKS